MADPPRLTFAFPIKSFRSIVPDQITIAFNELVVDLNAAFSALGGSSSGFITMKQLRRAMANQGVLVTYNNTVSADITNTINILWLSGSTVAVNDALYNDIATQLGYSAAQMATLFALAQTFAP